MNQSIHQLMQVILQGITWVFRTIEMLWDWSWTQIFRAFSVPWWNLPAWKLVLGIIFMIVLAYILYQLIKCSMGAFEKIAAAFWTMATTVLSLLLVLVLTAVFSRSFQWVVTTVPDRFWEKFTG